MKKYYVLKSFSFGDPVVVAKFDKIVDAKAFSLLSKKSDNHEYFVVEGIYTTEDE